MNNIIDEFLLTGEKLMPQSHLTQSGFTYSTCGPFTIHHERIKKWLDNNVLMYETHNEGKSVVAESFIRTLKGKIYKKLTASDKNLLLVTYIN